MLLAAPRVERSRAEFANEFVLLQRERQREPEVVRADGLENEPNTIAPALIAAMTSAVSA